MDTCCEIILMVLSNRKVNVIVVLGHERLYSDMARLYKERSGVNVVKLSKSGGVSKSKKFKYE